MNMEKSMASARLHGLTRVHTSESSGTIISMVKESTLGMTVGSTRVNGELIKCTVRAPSAGVMAASISASTLTIRKKDTESLSGLINDVTEENGLTVNSMAKVLTLIKMVKKNMANGRRENDYAGLGRWNKSKYEL